MVEGTQKKIYRTILIVLVLTIISLRLPMLFYGIPFDLGAEDENGFIGCALNYGASKNLRPILSWYPAFYSYILAISFVIYYLISLLFGSVSNTYEFAVEYLLHPGYFNFVGRIISILFSASSIVLLYFCGKKYKDPITGFYAAVLFTFSKFILWRTSWALPDSTYILMSILSIYFILRFSKYKGNKNIILSGLFCGLAISTKYNVGTLMTVGFMGVIIACYQSGKNLFENVLRILKTLPLYYYLIFVTVGFILGSPYWITDIQGSIAGLKWEIGRLSLEKSGTDFYLSKIPYIWIASELIISETSFGILIILTFAYSVYRSIKGDTSFYLFLPYLIFTIIMIGKQQKHSLHYLLPAFPVFMLVAGKTLSDLIVNNKKKVLSVSVLLFIILLFPIYHILNYSSSFMIKDTRVAAREWILENLPFGSAIAIGRTTNAPPLPDIDRFNKRYYSMISEQVMSRKLPDVIKQQYTDRIKDHYYHVTNYIIKRSVGRQESYSRMMADFDILKYDELSPETPEYIVFTSSDSSYLHQNGFRSILDVPGFTGKLHLKKVFNSKTENLRGPIIWIFGVRGT